MIIDNIRIWLSKRDRVRIENGSFKCRLFTAMIRIYSTHFGKVSNLHYDNIVNLILIFSLERMQNFFSGVSAFVSSRFENLFIMTFCVTNGKNFFTGLCCSLILIKLIFKRGMTLFMHATQPFRK